MLNPILQFEAQFLRKLNLIISKLEKDAECEEYFGYNIYVNKVRFKFRKSKITPKKVGQFVTLWKRNQQNITIPFDENDDFDYYIIASEDDEKSGYFIFPKSILIEKNILSTKLKDGKRGFRVYPNWVITTNKQAQKTQYWQQQYFFEIKNEKIITSIELEKILLQIKKGA